MKKRFGDRKDARKVRDISGIQNIMIDLKPRRCDSDVYINYKIDVSNLIKYIEKIKAENPDKKITYFHAFCAAFAKVVYNRPLLNRFIANRTVYERNDVIISFITKIALEDFSDEVMVLIKINKDDNIFTISEKIAEKINNIRNNKMMKKESTNNIVDIVGKLPKLIRMPFVGIIKWIDKHGWLPNSFIKENIYYSTVLMSNLGTLKIGAIYHNITNFGTSSILSTIGEIHKDKIIDKNGKEKITDTVEFGINLDERIADGVYFANSVKLLEYILNNPELLEGEANEKIEIN